VIGEPEGSATLISKTATSTQTGTIFIQFRSSKSVSTIPIFILYQSISIFEMHLRKVISPPKFGMYFSFPHPILMPSLYSHLMSAMLTKLRDLHVCKCLIS
jgi:hypothetical protein